MEQQKRDLNITKLKKINNLRKAVKSYDYTLCIKGTFWKKYLECSNIDKLIALIKTMNVQANWWSMDLKKIVINKIVMNWKKNEINSI